MVGRPPDFLIIGAMKSGTTSLFEWLGEQPEVWLPAMKEPRYFAPGHAQNFDRYVDDGYGRDWYFDLFAGAPSGAITGEASPSYTEGGQQFLAAARIAR